MKKAALAVTLAFILVPSALYARDAAFVGGGSTAAVNEDAVKVDPKADIDVGETAVNVAKRTSIFFVNQTNAPVKVEKVAINNDQNVTAEATADDCSKQGTIAPQSRCSIEISATPTGPGNWGIDILMTHNGAGRITRAHLAGKTSGSAAGGDKSMGLAVASKETKPIDFGDVKIGDGKIVRSTLMVNDSPEPITIYSIDVIEADNGLERLDEGCTVDMELGPGASCPVTLVWEPKVGGPVSTDLIIRHSGKLGFAVIPIRGKAGGETEAASTPSSAGKGSVPLPLSAQDLEKEMAGKIAPLLGGGAVEDKPMGDGKIHLIGTIGERALILKPDGETEVVAIGGEFDADGQNAKLTEVNAHSADIVIDGKKKTFKLEASSSIIANAQAQAARDAEEAALQKQGGGLPSLTAGKGMTGFGGSTAK